MAAEPPGGQRDPGEETVPACVGEADLLLSSDPQTVVDRPGLLGGPARDGVLQLGGVAAAGAEQPAGDPAGDPVGERGRAPPGRPGRGGQGAAAEAGGRARAGVQTGVQAAQEPAGGGDLRVGGGGGAGHHGGEQGPQLAGPHPPEEGRADHQHRGRRLGVRPERARPARRRDVLQPAVAVRGEGDGGGRGDVQPVRQFVDQPVQLGGLGAVQLDGRGPGRLGPPQGAGGQSGDQHGQPGDRADHPAGGVPAGGVGRARRADPAGEPAREQDHRHGGGQDGGGQRETSDPQDRLGMSARGVDSGHTVRHPLRSPRAPGNGP